MVYDFNIPQPIRGAKAYYMRMILHDYPNEQCRRILQNTISAMTEDSVLLVDEIVLPEVGAAWRATQMDMTMLNALKCMAFQVRLPSSKYIIDYGYDIPPPRIVEYLAAGLENYR
ncbi:hypothetical protein PMIN02_012307 [Paraphaeosphaeria minitans]